MRVTLGLIGLALLLSACSLAGDVTPPPGATSLAPVGTSAPTSAPIVEPLLPEVRPVSLDGGVVYQEHCAACHGPAGNGGGAMTAQLPSPPPDFSDPTTLRDKTPQDLFFVVTQGRVDRFMPPFADSLSVAERWNAVAYVYSLSMPAERRAAGQALYAAQCASCHGEQGHGDGPEAGTLATPPPNLSDQAYAAIRSAQDYAAVLTGDDPPHAFAAALSDEERWDAVDYARSLGYDYSPPEAVLAEGQGSVQGRVTNRTGGAANPGALPVTLYSFEDNAIIDTLTATADIDGTFVFDAVAFAPGRQFVATTQYQGVDYTSDPASFRPGAGSDGEPPVLDLPLPVYETTTDRTVLRVPQAHMFLEFDEPQQVTVGELYVFSNVSDRTLAGTSGDPLRFSLPTGASELNVQGGQANDTFFHDERGFGVIWTVPPGEGTSQILFSYKLPYQGGLSFDQPMDYPVDSFNLLVSDLNVSVTGDGLQNLGMQDFQGEQFQNYSQAALAPGDRLRFDLSGEPGSAAAGSSGGAVSSPLASSGTALGLGALGVVLLAVGFYLFRRKPGPPLATRDELLEAIAELDDDYAAQTVDEAEYRRERARLKGELSRIWKRE
jgi:mono/diheme cytochrome c family protein